MDFKEELAAKAEVAATTKKSDGVKLTKNMSIVDMIKALEPEIKRALPSVLTPERFVRMALTAVNNTPALAQCTPMSFIAALMNAAQLGLEPNTPLGQAYLIPYKNKKKGVVECQFQIGYKGMIDLVYRNDNVQTIQAHIVRENDHFEYELGLESKLRHIPAMEGRGEMMYVYRKECGEKEKGFLRKVKREHSLFKYQMLSGTNREIYDSCNKICFYENLIEYFLYNIKYFQKR